MSFVGIKEAFVTDGLKKSLLSYAAFVSMLFGFSGGQKVEKFVEERKTLKCRLLEKLHSVELKENGKTPSLDSHRQLLERTLNLIILPAPVRMLLVPLRMLLVPLR